MPQIGNAEINEVVECLKSGWLGTGPKVKRFENQFIKYKNSPEGKIINTNMNLESYKFIFFW